MHRRLTIGLASLVAMLGSTPAFAQAAKVEKAEKLMAKAEAGKPALYAKAWKLLGDAKEHPESRDDAKTWAMLAQVAYQYVENPDLDAPMPDPWETSWSAWDTAIGKGASAHAETAMASLTTMESVAMAEATNLYEGGDAKAAWTQLDRVLRSQKLMHQIGKVEPGREVASLKLALVVSTELADLDQAREMHRRLADLDGRKPGQTLAVAKAIEAKEGAASARDFLKPWVDQAPDEAIVVEAYASMLLALDEKDTLKAMLEATSDQVGNAAGITLVHARMWREVGDLDKSRDAFERALQVDAKNQDALRGFADLAMLRASDFSKQASETKSAKTRRSLRRQRDEAYMKAMSLLQQSRELEPGHLETLKKLREVYEEVGFDDKEEVAALEQAIADLEKGG